MSERLRRTKQVGNTPVGLPRLAVMQKSLNVVAPLGEGVAVPPVLVAYPHLEAPFRDGSTYETVLLMVDLTPFSTVSLELSPREIKGVLQHFYADSIELITRHGGIVEKFIGDAIVAIFGAPFTTGGGQSGAVLSAIAAASGVIVAVESKYGGELFAKASVVKGECFFGWLGTDHHPELTVVGSPLTTLFRLEDLATDGQIVVPEEDYRLIEPIVSGGGSAPHVIDAMPTRTELKGVGELLVRIIRRREQR